MLASQSQDTDLISKTPPLLLGRLDIRSLGVGIAFIARLRGGAPHSALSHTHCDLRERQRERRKRRRRGERERRGESAQRRGRSVRGAGDDGEREGKKRNMNNLT